jgi:anti-sigma factor RsiW
MPKCREIEALFAPYVDGEAAPAQRESVDAHISTCPPCRDLVAEERAAREVLLSRRQELRACASERLRARCAAHRTSARVRAAAGPGRSRLARTANVIARRSWVPLSLAATLLLAVGGVFVYSAINQVEALAAQLALDHMKCFQVGAVLPQDPAVAARHWASDNGWAVQIPPSALDRQLEFVSLRRCLVTEGRTAHMMYKWRGQPLSLFVVPEALRDRRDVEHIVHRFGQDAIIWSAEGRTYIVMARGQPPEIEPVVRYVKANAR